MAVQLEDDLFVMPTLDEPSAADGPEGEPIIAPPPAERGLASLIDMDYDAALQMCAPPAALNTACICYMQMPQRV